MNQNDWQQAPFQNQPKTVKKTVSFVEALKNIGGQTVSTLKNDVIKGTLSDGANMMFGGAPQPQRSNENPWANEWLPNRENDFSAKWPGGNAIGNYSN
jgi:hypothetical protein